MNDWQTNQNVALVDTIVDLNTDTEFVLDKNFDNFPMDIETTDFLVVDYEKTVQLDEFHVRFSLMRKKLLRWIRF